MGILLEIKLGFWYNCCMKVFSLSDLHLSINNPKPMNIFGPVWDNYVDEVIANWQNVVEDDDIVLIAGDISWAMRLEEAVVDIQWISQLKGKKVLLRGNHDYWWHSISALRNILPQNMYAVQNDCIRIGDMLVCGSRGWATPDGANFPSAEDEKIYKREVLRLEMSLQKMQGMRKETDTVVGMMHYPPFNVKFESSPFTRLFSQYGVKKVVYGHLHGNSARITRKVFRDGVEFFLTSCDSMSNKPLLIFDSEAPYKAE